MPFLNSHYLLLWQYMREVRSHTFPIRRKVPIYKEVLARSLTKYWTLKKKDYKDIKSVRLPNCNV